MEKRRNNSPLWFKILVLVLLLPLFSWPYVSKPINAKALNEELKEALRSHFILT